VRGEVLSGLVVEVKAVFKVGKLGREPPGFHVVVYSTEALILLLYGCNGSMSVHFKLGLVLVMAVVSLNLCEGGNIESMGRCSQGVVPSTLALEEFLEPIGQWVRVTS
jgi:hypothetical protein